MDWLRYRLDRAVDVAQGDGEMAVDFSVPGEFKKDRDSGNALTNIEERKPRFGIQEPRVAKGPLGQGPSLQRVAWVEGVEGGQRRVGRKAPNIKRALNVGHAAFMIVAQKRFLVTHRFTCRERWPSRQDPRERLEQMFNARKYCHSFGSPPVRGLDVACARTLATKDEEVSMELRFVSKVREVAGHAITLVADASLPSGNI